MEGYENMKWFELTDEAKNQMSKMMSKNPDKYAITLVVNGGGCAGFKYDWKFIDDEKDIRKQKLAKKKEIAKARKFFTEQKEMYKQPLESSTVGVPDEAKKKLEEYKQYLDNAKTNQEENNRRNEWFTKKTNEVFNKEFKGFEFTLDNRSVTYSPGDAAELKKSQATPMNFINKFLLFLTIKFKNQICKYKYYNY